MRPNTTSSGEISRMAIFMAINELPHKIVAPIRAKKAGQDIF